MLHSALHPQLPHKPESLHYSMRLPEGPACVFMACIINLLPGTLTAELGDERLQAHTLDKELNTEQKLAALVDRDCEKWREVTQSEKAWDPHLRSAHDVSGHHIQAADGGNRITLKRSHQYSRQDYQGSQE